MRVPRAQIVEISRVKPELGKECFNFTFLGTPTHWITLSKPAHAHGPYGFRRNVRSIGIEPDAAEEFSSALGHRPI
jgi:hypothetical protein